MSRDETPDPVRAHHQSGDECDPWCPPTFPHHTSDPAVVTPDATYRAVLGTLLENVHIGVSNDWIVVEDLTFEAPAPIRAAMSRLMEEWIDGEAANISPAVVTPDAGVVEALLAEHTYKGHGTSPGIAVLCSCGETSYHAGMDYPHTSEQYRNHVAAILASHVAAAREADRAEVKRLRRWKDEALPVIDGLQELGKALDLPLGARITGPDAIVAVQRLRERLAGLVAKIEALAADVEYHREHDGTDPTILRRDGEWADLQPVLRGLIPADAATALDAVREQAKAEALRELADDIDSTGYGWSSVVDAERFKARLRERAARHTPGDGA